ncbi:hypothetical protein NC653_023615 [Populus alba x Populus x berolinensis]|uniref:CASP-like protein n=2 Tax=Populus TaxID=3689 RepID=A0A4U5Q9N7_POPAL|nr:hypothetical protein NC653_023615 [Populus alba x Populus x berolinensis]TKS05477.1 hypothetical protein D5086_0000135740 [Populus alba]
MCCLVGFGFSFERLESFGGGGREGIEERKNHARVSKRCFHSSLTVVKVVVVLKLCYKISSIVDIPTETRAVAKGTAHLKGAYTHEKVEYKGHVIFDFVLRLGAVIAALPAAATMGTSDQTLPFTQFFEFQASYDDLPTSQ